MNFASLAALVTEPEMTVVEVAAFPEGKGCSLTQAPSPRASPQAPHDIVTTLPTGEQSASVASVARQWLSELKALLWRGSESDTDADADADVASSSQTTPAFLDDAVPFPLGMGPISAPVRLGEGRSSPSIAGYHCNGGESPSPAQDTHGDDVVFTTSPSLLLAPRRHGGGGGTQRSMSSTPPCNALSSSRERATIRGGAGREVTLRVPDLLPALDAPSLNAPRSGEVSAANDKTAPAQRQHSAGTMVSLSGRTVSLLRLPCYRPVVSPMLIVIDLDNTILRTRLSDIVLMNVDRHHNSTHHEGEAAYYIDAAFFAWFCSRAHRMGHLLAIASLTDGAADSHDFGASAAETVLYMLDRVLPRDRPYLTSTADIVCQPQTQRAPGKQSHLRDLQRLLNVTWQQSLALLDDDDTEPCCCCCCGGVREDEEDVPPQACGVEGRTSQPVRPVNARIFSNQHTTDDDQCPPFNLQPSQSRSESAGLTPSCETVNGNICTESRLNTTHSLQCALSACPSPSKSRGREVGEGFLPSWLSTDILLIDDNRRNCLVADHAGFHAVCCEEGGLTREWFARQTRLHQLLGFGLTP